MPKVYKKGAKWWFTVVGYKVPGKRSAMPTDYKATEETREAAQKYADAAQRAIDKRSSSTVKAGPRTVTDFAEAWLLEREQRGIGSVAMDKGRLRNHALPVIGAMKLGEVEPHHIRDLMRGLKRKINDGKMAPRSALHVYGILRAMFNDALMERLIVSSPMLIPRGELPQKVDKDPEWRQLATYESHEVRALLSDPRIPPRRRVEYGLKALAGLRHGEAAGLLLRHYDRTTPHLGQLNVVRSYEKKRTKTGVARLVPVHPELARLLDAWLGYWWPRVLGRNPGPDDLIVPTRSFTPVSADDANEAFKADLEMLGLRVDAGAFRDRGGHDFRAWFRTTALDNGASPEALRPVTHAKPKDVEGGYTRLPWRALCAAVAAIPLTLEGAPLRFATGGATGDETPRNDAYTVVTPLGLEPIDFDAKGSKTQLSDEEGSALATSCDPTLSWLVAGHATDSDLEET